MKKSRIIVISGLIVVLVLGIAFYLLIRNLDALVEAAIEKYGSEAAGTAVRVEEVRIKLSAGTGTIRGLTVANPEGFAPEPLFLLDEITLAADPSGLTSEIPVIESIAIGSPSFFYQINESGESNLGIVKENLEGQAKRRKEQEKTGSDEPVRLVVKQLAMAGGKGILDLTAIGGKRYEGSMPPITLRNIGGEDGITPSGLGQVVLEEMVRKLEQSAARQAAEKAIRKELGEKAGEVQRKLDEKLGPEAGETLKNLLDR